MESNETKAGVSPVLSTAGLEGKRTKPRWVSANTPPMLDGLYEVQTPDVTGSYWTDAYWDGAGWWMYGKHVTLMVRRAVPVTRWRTKARKPSNLNSTTS